jgi:hypothetical protein
MIGLKRYIRPGLAVSVIGHLGALIGGLFFVGANAFHVPPPEALEVEVVTPDEMPRFEGMSSTPSPPAKRPRPTFQAPGSIPNRAAGAHEALASRAMACRSPS